MKSGDVRVLMDRIDRNTKNWMFIEFDFWSENIDLITGTQMDVCIMDVVMGSYLFCS